jgi:hypothetical protein
MPASSLERLWAHDPARGLSPLDRVQRDRLRHAIAVTPVHATVALRPNRVRRPAVVLVAATAGALLFATAGWAVYETVFSTAAQVRDDFAVWSDRIELPPGAAWQRPSLEEQGLYGLRAAQMIALDQATCAWFRYWEHGFERSDSVRMRAAAVGAARVRAAMPPHPAGAPEEAGGYDASALDAVDAIIAEQRLGRARLTEQYLRANC